MYFQLSNNILIFLNINQDDVLNFMKIILFVTCYMYVDNKISLHPAYFYATV